MSFVISLDIDTSGSKGTICDLAVRGVCKGRVRERIGGPDPSKKANLKGKNAKPRKWTKITIMQFTNGSKVLGV